MRQSIFILNYSCGTVVDLHYAFPVASNGCSPLEPYRFVQHTTLMILIISLKKFGVFSIVLKLKDKAQHG